MNITSRQPPSAILPFARLVRFATSCLALLSLTSFHLVAATPAEKGGESRETTVPNPAGIKIGIVISSTDAETVWNAFRFASFALKEGDSVKVFLLAKGVDCQKLDSKDFKITEQMQAVVDAGELGCGYGTFTLPVAGKTRTDRRSACCCAPAACFPRTARS